MSDMPEKLQAAIKATEYKYFGDYEMSDEQRYAVDTLVEFAKRSCDGDALVDELVEALKSSSRALEEASKLLFAKGLQGCASIMLGHRDIAQAALAKATGPQS